MKKAIALILFTSFLISSVSFIGLKNSQAYKTSKVKKESVKMLNKKNIDNKVELNNKKVNTSPEKVNKTSIRIFNELLKTEDKKKNFILSPLSIQRAYSLLASLTTNRKDFEFLKMYDNNDLQTMKLNNSTMESLLLLNKNQLKKEKMLKIYFENLKMVEFPNQANKEKEQLQKRVLKEVIDNSPLEKENTAVILDAIRYYSQWVKPFDVKDTKDREFTTQDGKKIKVPTMYNKFKEAMAFVDNEKEVFAMSGKNSATVYFIKPKKNTENFDIEKALQSFKSEWIEANVSFYLPKVEFKSETKLLKLFETLGLSKMLKNFKLDKILPNRELYVSAAKQVASLKIDEKGAEAKAITSIEMNTTSIKPPAKNIEIKMNSPYYIVIEDRETNTNEDFIAFMAYVANPAEK